MKTSFGLLSALMVTTGLLAQITTNPPPVPIDTPPASAETASRPNSDDTGAPVKKGAPKKHGSKKSVPKPKAPVIKTVPLVPGTAVVVVSNLNVRGQAKLNSEVVAHLTKDAVVTVLEEITLKHSAPDEPSAWAKIILPSDAHVWVNTLFIGTNRTVSARKLNLRAGPGENYSVLGLLRRGDEIKEMNSKGDWLEIEAPTNAYAFVAAQYLRQEAAETPPAAPTPVTPVATVPPPENPPAAAPPETAKVTTPAPLETPPPAKPVEAPPPAPTTVTTAPAAPVEAPPAAAATPVPELPPAPRIVTREGIVRGTVSIQAPSRFELMNAGNRKTIDYLHPPSPDLDLSRWKGLHVLVTGQEGLDERWPNTPVLTIQKIEVLDEP